MYIYCIGRLITAADNRTITLWEFVLFILVLPVIIVLMVWKANPITIIINLYPGIDVGCP